MTEPRNVPRLFCWTRFGTEAGETVEAILQRKERERRANGGIFLWGIGNSVASGIRELIREVEEPEVLFSPIRGRPRRVDVSPARVVEWQVAETMDGRRLPLPQTFHVRGGSGTERLAPRYALVCAAAEPLEVADHGRLSFGDLRNLLSGRRLGASQVTAVVRRINDPVDDSRHYLVAIRARLVEPFFIRLHDPLPIGMIPSPLRGDR